MKERMWRERAGFLFCLLCGGVGLWLLFRYASAVVWTLLVCWAVASAVTPMARRLAALTGLPYRLWAFLGVMTFLVAGGGLLALGCSVLWNEAKRLFAWLSDHRVWLKIEMDFLGEHLAQWLPRLSEQVSGAWGGLLSGWLDGLLTSLGKTLAFGVGRVARELPGAVIFVAVTVMGSFYLSMDDGALCRRLLSLLPEEGRRMVERLRTGVSRTLRGWLRAYLILLCLTFLELLVGLLILGRSYPLLIALGIALLDLLPVLGVGTALIPWGIVMLMLGEIPVGVGLLILYAVITVVHQIVEPKLMGDHLGLHPFVSLMAMFAGLSLLGFPGMIAGPLAAVVLKDTLRR